MSLEMTDSQRGGEMGQVFDSELAGHLFTGRGTDTPGRISDTYFAGEKQQRLGHSQQRMVGFSAGSGLPAFGLDEAKSRIRTLTLHGIILLEDHCPSCETLVPSLTAPLACLRLQPPDFKLLDRSMEEAEARQSWLIVSWCRWLPSTGGTLSILCFRSCIILCPRRVLPMDRKPRTQHYSVGFML